jgi:hypothetical protein
MPILIQPNALWTGCKKLRNDEIEGLVIEGRHLTELLQAELKLREKTPIEFPLQNEVQRAAKRIQKDVFSTGLQACGIGYSLEKRFGSYDAPADDDAVRSGFVRER